MQTTRVSKEENDILDKILPLIEKLEAQGYAIDIRPDTINGIALQIKFGDFTYYWNTVPHFRDVRDKLQATLQYSSSLIPNWSDAPTWARYWAVDKSGWSYWYQDMPVYDKVTRIWRIKTLGRYTLHNVINSPGQDPETSLQERPE